MDSIYSAPRCNGCWTIFPNRLPETLAQQLRRHLDECTDCRVAHQRAGRLQQFLALKRHERPSPEYFDSFLSRFHQRIEVEARRRTNWWERLIASVAVEPPRGWRYALVSVAGVLLAAGFLMTSRIVPTGQLVAGRGAADRRATTPAPAISTELAKNIPSPIPVLAEPSLAYNATTASADEHNEASAPRYVLDRITVTPASYEVASIHF